MAAYQAGLRGQLEHLLASRLAERHGISLYDDPAAARRVFAGGKSRLRQPVAVDRPGPGQLDQPSRVDQPG